MDEKWVTNEMDQLRQDAEEAHVATCTQEAKADKWYGAYERKNDQFNRLKEHFESKLTTTNAGLRNKCMILLDLVDAYEKYRECITPDRAELIKTLRQQGGFSV